jgi:hypothetical protein
MYYCSDSLLSIDKFYIHTGGSLEYKINYNDKDNDK